MDLSTILIKTAGAVLLVWTLRSIYKHIKDKRDGIAKQAEEQSLVESFLNNALLYLWLAFMVIFSTGMIVNN
jgi:hypothetical protein